MGYLLLLVAVIKYKMNEYSQCRHIKIQYRLRRISVAIDLRRHLLMGGFDLSLDENKSYYNKSPCP
jgi:hypothetical protein